MPTTRLSTTSRKRGRQIFAATIIAFFAALATASKSVDAKSPKSRALSAIHMLTAARFTSVNHLSAEALLELKNSTLDDVVIMDVREPMEHRVSHLPDSIRVSPAITPQDFAKKFAAVIQGKTLVLYCSVGVRSTELAARILPLKQSLGITKLYNLRGGIFNWHNHALPLATSKAATNRIHPYNRRWAYLLNRRELITYTPAQPL